MDKEQGMKAAMQQAHFFRYLIYSLCTFTSVAQGELPVGETPPRSSVQEIIQKEEGTSVDVIGVVLRQIGPRTVLVHDGTAAVEVDIPPEQVPEGGLKPNARIRIRGELVKDSETEDVELDASQIFWSF